MNRTSLRLTLCIALACSVSACGGGGASGGSPPALVPTPAASPGVTATPAATPTPARSPTSTPTPTGTAPPPTALPATLYSANFFGTAVTAGLPSVTAYAAGASANAAPSVILAGTNTGFVEPFSVALDAANNIYVSDWGSSGGNIFEFATGASGNVAPVRTIANVGYENGGTDNGLAVDTGGNVYAVSAPNSQVRIYGATQNGNVAPAHTIGGPNSGIQLPNVPQGLALDAQGNVYVSLIHPGFGGAGTSGYVAEYAADSYGDPTPIRTIGGPLTNLVSPQGMAIDKAGNLYATDRVNNAVFVFGPTANGNVAPARAIVSPVMQQPLDVVLDGNGNLYVAQVLTFQITAFPANSNGFGTPLFSLGGSNTGFNGRGIAFAH